MFVWGLDGGGGGVARSDTIINENHGIVNACIYHHIH